MSVRLAARLEGFESRPITNGIDYEFWPVPSTLLLECGVAVLDGAGGEGALVACSTRRQSRPITNGIDYEFWPVPSTLLLECGVAVLDGAGGEGALVACSTRRQPSRQVNPAYTISNRAPSTTRTPLQQGAAYPA
jgi:hypothetical protein